VSDERVRLFVALELPAEVRDALAAWAVELGLGGLRLLAADQLHVTLCFLGWQAADAVQPIAAACRAVGTTGGLELRLGQAAWLPARRPRVLAVTLEDPGGRAARLQADLSGGLEEGGWYAPERRAYMPHVTVARVRRGAKVRPVDLRNPAGVAFTASDVTLFRSRLSAAGARYEALTTVQLG
jgi:2'-5' RNA ligase